MAVSRLILPALAVILLLASYYVAWQAGATYAQGECSARADRAAKDAQERVRQIEKERFIASEIAATNYLAELERTRTAARDARGELRRLRDELDARDRAAGIDPPAAIGAHGPASERTILRDCAAKYLAMAREADGLAARLKGLQDYVSGLLAAEH